MSERRMFAKTIIDSDAFLDMPISARLLYYDLGMRADDDGFVNSPKKIMRMCGATNDDMNILILRKFIIPFESGIVVIKHWRIHNYIRKDTYNETNYKDEKSLLEFDENKAYKLIEQSVDDPSTQVRLGKDSIGKDSIVYISLVTEIYKKECTNLPQIKKITEKRQKSIIKFLKEFDVDQFTEICKIANNSSFLTGNNKNKWKADFDFLMRTDKATSILEGRYSNDKGRN